MRETLRTKTVALALAAMLILAVAAATPAAATDERTVGVQPTETTVEPGETTTFDVAIDDADRGVGAGELAVRVDDPSVATITDIQIRGDPGFSDISRNDDNSSVALKYATADTANGGDVTVLTVTVRGDASGSTSVSATSTDDNEELKLFDEQGERYDIASSTAATLTAGDGDGGDDNAENDGGDGTSDEEEEDEDESQEDDSTPGFGVVVALVSLIGAAAVARRRGG